MKNIIRTCNLTVRFSKFTLNIEIYEVFVEFLGEKLCSYFSIFYLWITSINYKIGYICLVAQKERKNKISRKEKEKGNEK